MVESGLASRIEVSQYRLAAHLAAAVVIYGAMLWVALDLLYPPAPRARGAAPLRHAVTGILALAFLAFVAGSFVAGLRAGYIFNDFPLMGGEFVPGEFAALSPWWRNWFENPAAAQFDHRLLAEITWLAIAGLWLWSLRRDLGRRARLAFHALFAMSTLQVALGIATLLLVVPLSLAVLHQVGGVLLVTAALVAHHSLRPL
jgi:cytochrome c oxidase assembly protein subunit 15